MAGAVDDSHQLRQRVYEIDHLGNKEKKKRLRKVPQHAHYRKRHTCKIAIGVANKNLGREEVVAQQRQCTKHLRECVCVSGRE